MATLLITGATGFLGGAVAEAILTSPKKDNIELLLLVRAGDADTALERVKKNLRKFSVSEKQLEKLTTHNMLVGDLATPETFLDDPRLDHVTHVLNCAAIASFGSNPLIRKVNVDGTLAFARRMSQVSGMQRFLHVGTAMSCTPKPDTLVTESSIFTEDAEHLVEYTRSKADIEQQMKQYCPTLPLLIARPSIVVGHTQHGCTPSGSIFWVFRMGLMLQKFMCNLDDKIDVIPVDYCAKALLMLLNLPLPQGDVVHISAGEEGSVTFSDIDKAIASSLNQMPVGDKYQKVSYPALIKMRHELKTIFGPCNERLMLKAMRLYGEFAALNVRFSNDKLRSLGMPASPRFTSFIDGCVQSTLDIPIPQLMAVDFK